MKLFTIGFTKKTAEVFFETLKKAGVCKLIDIRLNNNSQLAGFTKSNDLKYFSKLVRIEYVYMPEFAPTNELLDNYKKGNISWQQYENIYKEIIEKRLPIKNKTAEFFENACLLCSEPKADQCHRKLAAQYVKKTFPDIDIIHL